MHIRKQDLQWHRSEGHIGDILSQACLTGDASASGVFPISPLPSPGLKVKTLQGLCQRTGDWDLEAIADPEECLNQSHYPKPQDSKGEP